MRTAPSRTVELLAPAGTFEIAKALLETPCDAIYLGGPYLNMRMIRKGYNLSLEELEQIVPLAHSYNKKIYITLNNMLSEGELQKTREYLRFLAPLRPDGLIIQDFALFTLLQEEQIEIPLHSSVMMNVHNIEMIQKLQQLGVSRVVLSRELSLKEIKELSLQTDVELEYFTHGDMCSVHGSLCYYSSLLFGMSSNRGRCLKPCRWEYTLRESTPRRVPEEPILYKGFPLAVKDMNMIEHIPEMIDAGVQVFKIEGRMRQKEFIIELITRYGNAIDAYLHSLSPTQEFGRTNQDSPKATVEAEAKWIQENRKRDLSQGYAFGNPGLSNLNSRYEGTGKLYSTGKVFSTPTPEPSIQLESQYKPAIATQLTKQLPKLPAISLEVTTIDQLTELLPLVSRIYLSLEGVRSKAPTKDEIERVIKRYPHKIWLKTPTMIHKQEADFLQSLLKKGIPLAGISCTNLGAIKIANQYNYPIHGESTLNLYNTKAMECYKKLGVSSATISVESPIANVEAMGAKAPLPLEIIGHGNPTVMLLDHSLFQHYPLGNQSDTLILESAERQMAHLDIWGRTHIQTGKELALLPLRRKLGLYGISALRIVGGSYTLTQLKAIIAAYTVDKEVPLEELPSRGEGFTLGALGF